ncbi:MAG: cytochrome b/b6 domain-containing protein [Candidatus Eisenbacteria bacterium]
MSRAAVRWLLSLSLLLLAGAASAQDFTSEECAMCHAAGEEGIPLATDSMVALSSHAGFGCLDCHADIVELPHAEALEAVACGVCHGAEYVLYVTHGRGTLGETEDIPGCADCHGSHEILASNDKRSAVHPLHLPATCGRCHEDVDLAKKHDIQLKRPVEVYESSVHGRATRGGIYVAATCTDCHSTEGTAHRILGPGDASSSINHFNVPHTCGKCHRNIEQDYWEGIHGKLAARGETDTPVCTHCHGEHGILAVSDPRARVSPILVAEATCAPCHESAFLNEKYGIPAGRLASFVDSYHGLKSKAGDPTVANCASCHGAHRILPSADPNSSIHQANLRATCGGCHPGVSEELAATKIHETGVGRKTGWPRFFGTLYIAAISVIVGLMVLYVVVDWRKHYIEVLRRPQIRRMNADAIFQHSVLTLSFTVLVITGFALVYSEAWIFRLIFGWDGGFRVRGIVHRAAAGVFIFGCLWHLGFLATRNGKRFFADIFPTRKDFTEFWEMILYNLGRRQEGPRFGRFGYVEKAEYWALLWGGVVMIITGLFLWFDNQAVRFLPKGFLDVMLVIHHYEAWLATLAILVWHFYSTIFCPCAYPGNPSWITGSMPVDMYLHEHPEDEAVRGLVEGGAGRRARPGGAQGIAEKQGPADPKPPGRER